MTQDYDQIMLEHTANACRMVERAMGIHDERRAPQEPRDKRPDDPNRRQFISVDAATEHLHVLDETATAHTHIDPDGWRRADQILIDGLDLRIKPDDPLDLLDKGTRREFEAMVARELHELLDGVIESVIDQLQED